MDTHHTHDIPCPVCGNNICGGLDAMTPAQARDAGDGYCIRCAAYRACVPDTDWTTIERRMVIESLGPDFRLQLAQALVYRWRVGAYPLRESITCPVCGKTSHNYNDVREGYCGVCHEFTSCVDFRDWTAAEAAWVKETLGPDFHQSLAERLVHRWRVNRGAGRAT